MRPLAALRSPSTRQRESVFGDLLRRERAPISPSDYLDYYIPPPPEKILSKAGVLLAL
jgi:hypothetical protein